MLAVILAVSGLLAVICFFVLFGVRKKVRLRIILFQHRRSKGSVCGFVVG